jgi:hypothetical protein
LSRCCCGFNAHPYYNPTRATRASAATKRLTRLFARYGAYRGKHSFESFTYKRGVLFRHGIFDIASLLPDGAGNVKYPPNTALRKVLLPMTVQYLPMLPRLFTLKNGLWLAAAVCMARKDSREVVVAKVLAGIRAAVEA